MNLSEHFTLAEMTVTDTGLPNVPGEKEIEALKALCENVLEKVREHFTAKYCRPMPVKVRSGFRSPEVNKAVGGKSTSQHLKGEAADIEIDGVPNEEIWHFICDVYKNFDQVIAEKLVENNPSAGWIHVSFSTKKKRQSAISFIGKYVEGFHYYA